MYSKLEINKNKPDVKSDEAYLGDPQEAATKIKYKNTRAYLSDPQEGRGALGAYLGDPQEAQNRHNTHCNSHQYYRNKIKNLKFLAKKSNKTAKQTMIVDNQETNLEHIFIPRLTFLGGAGPPRLRIINL